MSDAAGATDEKSGGGPNNARRGSLREGGAEKAKGAKKNAAGNMSLDHDVMRAAIEHL